MLYKSDKNVLSGQTYVYHSLPYRTPDGVNPSLLISPAIVGTSRASYSSVKCARPNSINFQDHNPYDLNLLKSVQTEDYIEYLTDEIECDNIYTQTDDFLSRTPSPEYRPAKTGIDAETQIEEGELFDFDKEVEPILGVLLGKTLEQSMLEVVEEEELAELRKRRESFETLYQSELMEIQRLQARYGQPGDEEENQYEAARQTTKKMLDARQFSRQFLNQIWYGLSRRLWNEGYFDDFSGYDDDEIKADFLKPLFSDIDESINNEKIATLLVDEIIYQAVKQSLGIKISDDQSSLMEMNLMMEKDEDDGN